MSSQTLNPSAAPKKHTALSSRVARHLNQTALVPTRVALQRATDDSRAASPSEILMLQRQYGNQAVLRLLATHSAQPKLNVGPAGDSYEQEADRVADQVLAMSTPQVAQSQPAVQRQGEEEEVQTKPLGVSIAPLVQRQGEEEEVQTKLLLQRQGEEEEVQTKPLAAANSFEAGADFEQRLSAARSGGAPLPDSTRAFMEPRFGADFSDVRLHTGSESAQLNRAISAQAFTQGQDIYLGEGKENVETTAGKQLLAHELTHTVQQNAVRRKPAYLQRHSEEEEAKGIQADDLGAELEPGGSSSEAASETKTPEAEEEVGVQRKPAAGGLIQRWGTKKVSTVKASFDEYYNKNKKVEAVNFLKKKYALDTKEYTLTVSKHAKAGTHAATSGGWSGDDKKFTPIMVDVNEPYLDKQAKSEDGFNKLIHTLGHEYQHVKQRSRKGWKTTGDSSAKGEREFMAYSWEILDSRSKKGMAELAAPEKKATINKAIKLGYNLMSDELKKKHKKRYDKLIAIRDKL